ncbi:serine/threonine-protein kinase [Bacillus sp. 166amftsu]|uniref:serine/threonine-protein kinase n=1 Tax=Bacillus sp. 166amftsu TaxID=1761753 RepID=UPI00089A9871|nr:serine/threonine-protein kinase [Bacillus sp. 166amftsu]SDZ43149.1 Protein kinase domain-containing protein [Bacillus sp. 166amftsu]
MDYQILSVKGSGYFCDVWKAKNEFKKTVALKQLKKEFVQNSDYIYRFKREISLLKELKECPYIIPCLDMECDNAKQIYRYAMPLADYHLHKYITKYNSGISLQEKIMIFDQILVGMKYAHERTIIHRDLSPNNVLIFIKDQNVQVKISDFGLGKDTNSLSHFSKSVGSYGQIYYVAPEQYENIKSATVKSDIYSLGKLLYFILTAKNPLIIEPTVGFYGLISKAVSENPEKRHQDINEFITHYEQLKAIYMQSETLLTSYETMKQYTENNKEQINWSEFHKMVLEGNVINHVFVDYLEPIVELFREVENLEAYTSYAKEEISTFLEAFTNHLHECYNQYGWPFRYLDDFARFFYNLYNILPFTVARLTCLKELWNISFEYDQWNAQTWMESIIRGRINPDNIEPFAEFLTGSNSKHADKIIQNGNLSQINPILRTSIRAIVQRAENMQNVSEF